MRLARGEGKEGLGQLTDPGGGDRDDGPRARGDADGGIGRGPASAVHRAAALEREGATSRGFCAVLLGESFLSYRTKIRVLSELQAGPIERWPHLSVAAASEANTRRRR